MSDDNSDGNTPSLSRRRVLAMTGSFGTGAIAVPSVASADQPARTEETINKLGDSDWNIDVHERGSGVSKYVGNDGNAEPRVFPFASINRDIVCLYNAPIIGDACLHFQGVLSWHEVSFDVSVAGISLLGAGVSTKKSLFSADFKSSEYPVSGSISVNANWHGGNNVDISVDGTLCAGKGPIELCKDGSVTIVK